MRACACELRRARVLSLAQCDVGRGGWSRELHFPHPHPPSSLRLPPTPASSAQPPAVICITKARRSREEKGRGVRLSPGPRGYGVAALTPGEATGHLKLKRGVDPAHQSPLLPHHCGPSPILLGCDLGLATSLPSPFASPVADLLLKRA